MWHYLFYEVCLCDTNCVTMPMAIFWNPMKAFSIHVNMWKYVLVSMKCFRDIVLMLFLCVLGRPSLQWQELNLVIHGWLHSLDWNHKEEVNRRSGSEIRIQACRGFSRNFIKINVNPRHSYGADIYFLDYICFSWCRFLKWFVVCLLLLDILEMNFYLVVKQM